MKLCPSAQKVLIVSLSGVCGASGKVTCSTTEHGAGLPPVFLIGKPGEERRQERGGRLRPPVQSGHGVF